MTTCNAHVYMYYRMSSKQAHKMQILVADDHALMREGLSNLLSGKEGLEVCAEAKNGIEAVRLAGQLHPNVILMDVSMPELDGIEATTLIKKNHPEISIIALSMHDSDAMKQKMLAAGASTYINKEAASAELMLAIRKVK